ncbi:CHAD domain-containing protein [Microbulbifer halophilus]|uniref:CHAD domain-containing protein n=2 Tax=Microbulbifer halophilus TaxID=453963 RepID=A0ABW5EFQ2_9GAMM|nr:CHAD domain-containing protein [Microbulbifer halophilus]MCW8127752.1 CHAD domain-containing protein [Microbulbifer halophilus]
MAYRLDSDTPLGRALRTAARQQLADAAEDLTALPEEEAVHATRKHCKKLRALLRLVRGELGDLYRYENAHYRTLANTLSTSRDAVSLRDALEKLSPDDKFPQIQSFLESRIQRTEEPALRTAAELLHQGAARIDHWPLDHLRWRNARKGYRRSYKRARKAMKKAFEEETPEQFHEYRKRVKDHWYHTRLLEDKYAEALGGRRKPLKKLASALGDWRDLQLLRRRLVLEGESFEGELIPLLDAIEARLGELRRKLEKLSRKLFVDKKFAFDD